MVDNLKKTIDPYSINDDFSMFYKSLLECKNVKNIKILNVSGNLILVTLDISINLPGRRSRMKVDIKDVEPIILECSPTEILYKAPWVFSGRRDFPSNKLPHTSTIRNFYAHICLHRGNIDDWYVDHSIEDFINRIRSWFSDAASGNLIRPGDDFESILIDQNSATAVYSYDKITEFIQNYWDENNGKSDFAYTLCCINDDKEVDFLNVDKESLSLQILDIQHRQKLSSLVRKCNLMRNKNKNIFMGILGWGSKTCKYTEYYKLPYMNLNDLYKFNELIGIDLKKAIELLKEKKIPNSLFLISSINRPTNIIGRNKNIDLVNFGLLMERVNKSGVTTVNLESKVFILNHLEPLTKKLASNISNTSINTNPKILIAGAGALGSKIIFHLARSGYTNLTIIDNDKLYPHNLIRHALFSDSLNKNKADEITSKLKNMYLLDPDKNFNYEDCSFIEYAKTHNLNEYDVLLDFTASKSIFQFISNYEENVPKVVIRAELANNGQLGLLLVEGKGRIPKLDDLQVKLFDNANINADISNWLSSYKNLKESVGDAEFEDITIGMGCNTNTMKLADDIISYHASIFCNHIKKILQSNTMKGEVLISYFNENDYSENYCKSYSINEFVTKKSNDDWTIKLYIETYNKILEEFKKATPKETGGILLGHINIKNKIIYVTDIFLPKDNKNDYSTLYKGSEGTCEYLKHISVITGGMISYVGDWHTHPNSSTVMSGTDKKAILELKSHLSDISYPAHVMIFNESEVNSYIMN